MKALPLLLACVLLASCAGNELKDAWNALKGDARPTPGQKRLVAPAGLTCLNKERPYAEVQLHEVRPHRLEVGNEFVQRFRYALCTDTMAVDSMVRGELVRRVLYKGRAVYTDVTHDYELHPGQWESTAAIFIPRRAEAGVYLVTASFNGGAVVLNWADTLEVFGK